MARNIDGINTSSTCIEVLLSLPVILGTDIYSHEVLKSSYLAA